MQVENDEGNVEIFSFQEEVLKAMWSNNLSSRDSPDLLWRANTVVATD